MCQPCHSEFSLEECECCCSPAMRREEEIMLLEAMKSIQIIRLNAIGRKIEILKQSGKE